MSLAEEKVDEEMLIRNSQRLSAAICKRQLEQDHLDKDSASDEDENFDFQEIDDEVISSESDGSIAEIAQNKVSNGVSYIL